MLVLSGWVLLHLMLAAGLTLLARRYALRRDLLDHPGERRSHSVATPRGGGISIVAVTLFGVIFLAVRFPGQAPALAGFWTGLLLVAAVGWIDDHRPLSPWLRLAVHIISGATLGVGLYVSGETLATAMLALVLAVVLVNVWNFMDGIDGLASSQALLAALSIAWLLGSSAWGWLAAGLVAALAGFLPFNFPRARIFLGDVGSGAIGYVLAALLIAGVLEHQTNWMLLFLPFTAFFVDASLTLAARIMRGEKWWTPHVQHAYQRWAMRRGHVRVTVAYGLFSLGALLCMVWSIGLRPSEALWVSAFWFGFAACTWVIQQRTMQ